MSQPLVIVDTGCANIASVNYAFERLGVKPVVTDDHAAIKQAVRVLLPGVGTASAAMQSIESKGLTRVIQSLEQPVLGICLGMQLLAEQSEELPGSHLNASEINTLPCLGVVPSQISRMETNGLVLPHMGWNQIKVKTESPLFKGIDNGSYFYFVHSFSAPISEYTLASCEYGQAFSAAIGKDNFQGVQFHPERSGDAGAQLLKNFIEM